MLEQLENVDFQRHCYHWHCSQCYGWSTIPNLRGRHYDCCTQHVHVELSFTGCIFGSYEKPWTFALMQGCLELLDCTLLSYCQHH